MAGELANHTVRDLDAAFGSMADNLVGTMRWLDEETGIIHWSMEESLCLYHPNVMSSDTRLLQVVRPVDAGGVHNQEFLFESKGLLAVLGIEVDKETYTSGGLPNYLSVWRSIEISFGIQRPSKKDSILFQRIIQEPFSW